MLYRTQGLTVSWFLRQDHKDERVVFSHGGFFALVAAVYAELCRKRAHSQLGDGVSYRLK